jgi:DNA-binding LacI/PurR family transcriptional regulator
MAVTMRDVAARAGVSTATVSFVLNQTPGQHLRPETIDRVREAARSLGYTPNRIARALREGTSRLVLLQAGSTEGGSLPSMIRGLDGELRAHGHALLVTYGESDDEALLQAVAPRVVLGLEDLYLTFGSGDPARGWSEGLARHTATQLDYLVGRGHRRIAYARPAMPAAPLAGLRLDHVREHLRRLGLPEPAVLTVADDAASALEALRTEHPDVTAIAAFSDDTGLRVLAAAAACSLRVPDDLAVIGFDDAGLGDLWIPSLTSVRIDAEGYGRRLARSVLGLDPEQWVNDPSEVVVRGSA